MNMAVDLCFISAICMYAAHMSLDVKTVELLAGLVNPTLGCEALM